MPKSRTLIWPSLRLMMFSGFRSRCTMPCACAAASAAAISISVLSSWSGGSAPSRKLRRAALPRRQARTRCRARRRFPRERRPWRWRDGKAPRRRALRASAAPAGAGRGCIPASAPSAPPPARAAGPRRGIDDAHAAAADLSSRPGTARCCRPVSDAWFVEHEVRRATPQAGSSRKPAARAWLRSRVSHFAQQVGVAGGLRVEKVLPRPPAHGRARRGTAR